MGRATNAFAVSVLLLGSAAWNPGTAQEPHPPTFAEEIAPILYRNCASCHRPGGPGPFSVLRYEEVKERADRIAEMTAERRMPPWLPEPGVRSLVGERRLEEEEIEAIGRWARAGAPRGDPAHLPEPPEFPSGWWLGPPDLVVRAPSYGVPAKGVDLYRNLVIPAPVDSVRWVRAVELRPGHPRVVHHARLMVDTTSGSRERAAEDPQPGFDGMDPSSSARNPSGHFVGWTPGRVPHGGYDDLAWRLGPESDLVLQLHLRPTGRSEVVEAEVGLHLAEGAPERPTSLVGMGTEIIDIPPGEPNYVVTDSFTLPVPVEIRSVYPHAHYLGKRLEGYARLPDGTVEPLIRIDDWDFNWQDEYRFADPLPVPAGTELWMRYTYDNSRDNRQNPNDPPVRVRYGSRSTDEMADLVIQVVPRRDRDLAELERALSWKYERAAVDYGAWIERVRAREAAAAGDDEGALRHYRASLRQRENPRVLVEMAEVLLGGGDAPSARVVADRAVQVTGRADAAALGVLGRALGAEGRIERALEVLEEARSLARKGGEAELAARLERWVEELKRR